MLHRRRSRGLASPAASPDKDSQPNHQHQQHVYSSSSSSFGPPKISVLAALKSPPSTEAEEKPDNGSHKAPTDMLHSLDTVNSYKKKYKETKNELEAVYGKIDNYEPANPAPSVLRDNYSTPHFVSTKKYFSDSPPHDDQSLPLANDPMLAHIQSFVTGLIQNSTFTNQLAIALTPEANSGALTNIPSSSYSSLSNLLTPGPTVSSLGTSPINLQNEIYELRQAVKQNVQQQQDFMNAILYSVIHRNPSFLSVAHGSLSSSSLYNSKVSESASSTTMMVSTTDTPLHHSTNNRAGSEELSFEERRAMSWALRNMVTNTTEMESSIEQISANGTTSSLFTQSINLKKPLFPDSPSYSPNEHLDSNGTDEDSEASPLKQRRTDPGSMIHHVPDNPDTNHDTSLLIRVIAQLEEERVQLLARLAELEEYIIPERDDLIKELKVSLLQSVESNQEYSSMATIFHELIDHVKDIENTNTELAILAKCTEIDKIIVQNDKKDNNNDVNMIHDGPTNDDSIEELSVPESFVPSVPSRSSFDERVQNFIRKKRSRSLPDTPEIDPSIPTILPLSVGTEENSTVPVPTDTLTTISFSSSSLSTNDVLSVPATTGPSTITEALGKRIAILEDELATSNLARELLYEQLKELREKARANQLKLINEHIEEINLLKQVHAKTIARILGEKCVPLPSTKMDETDNALLDTTVMKGTENAI